MCVNVYLQEPPVCLGSPSVTDGLNLASRVLQMDLSPSQSPEGEAVSGSWLSESGCLERSPGALTLGWKRDGSDFKDLRPNGIDAMCVLTDDGWEYSEAGRMCRQCCLQHIHNISCLKGNNETQKVPKDYIVFYTIIFSSWLSLVTISGLQNTEDLQ